MKPLLVSIVSHLQWRLAKDLLADLAALESAPFLRVVLTMNLPEPGPDPAQRWPFPLEIVGNDSPRGFGANHNAAFQRYERVFAADAFCVLNPDVRLPQDVFPALMADLDADAQLAVVGPLIRNSHGIVEDSARRLPTPGRILAKALRGSGGRDYEPEGRLLHPEWIAGMFMLFRSAAFRQSRGFDERYFLYYEDVDLCARLRLSGLKVAVDGRLSAIHDAQRASHRSLRYTRHHLQSLLRFFASPAFRNARRLDDRAGA